MYVDARTFFAQEFCQTQKNKETKQKQEKPFSKTARRGGTYVYHKCEATELMGGWRQYFGKFHNQITSNMWNQCLFNLSVLAQQDEGTPASFK